MSNNNQDDTVFAEIENKEYSEIEKKVEEEIEEENKEMNEEIIETIKYDKPIDPIVDNYLDSLVMTRAMIKTDVEERMLKIIMSCNVCDENKAKLIIQQKLKKRPLEYDIVSNVKKLNKAYNIENFKSELYVEKCLRKH